MDELVEAAKALIAVWQQRHPYMGDIQRCIDRLEDALSALDTAADGPAS
jgi:hypothetical protein